MKNKQPLPILVSGSKGLIGSKFADRFKDSYKIEPIDISDQENPVDITKIDEVINTFENSRAEYVVHFAAYTDVTGAWEQRGDKSGIAYRVNVDGTKNILTACKKTGKKIIHVSTAYVFDGKKEGAYLESDNPNPLEWYGQTKLFAEEAVLESDVNSVIFRIDQPFRSDRYPRLDIVHRIIEKLNSNNLPPMFINHYFGPTFIDDFIKVIDWSIRKNIQGLYHSSSGESWTDYDFALMVKSILDLSGDVRRGDLNEYLGTLSRPYQKNTALDNSKLVSEIDFEMLSIRDAVAEVKL